MQSSQDPSNNPPQSNIQEAPSSEEDHVKDTTLFECVDKAVLTLFNEPSLGLYYTQQHIQSTFPKLLFYMDNLYDNRKVINNTILDANNTIRDIKEITSLNDIFTFKMLARIKNINFALKSKIGK